MNISNIFSSKAKVQVLGVLSQDSTPLRTRTIERRAGLPIRSVQLALDSLVNLDLVHRQTLQKYPTYKLNTSHISCKLIRKIFKAVEIDQVSQRSFSYNQKATRVFQFISDANRVIQRAQQ